MRYAGMNPADIYFSKGKYGVKRPLPSKIGYEGSGYLVDAEKSIKTSDILNKKVACWGNFAIDSGTWSNYFITDLKNCIFLDKNKIGECNDSTLINYTNPRSNPMTALGF